MSGEETSEPAGTESGEVTTSNPGEQTTQPTGTQGEGETQSEQGDDNPLPLSLILAVLGVVGVGCIVAVVFALIKYARAAR